MMQVGSELAFPIAGNIAHESELVNLSGGD